MPESSSKPNTSAKKIPDPHGKHSLFSSHQKPEENTNQEEAQDEGRKLFFTTGGAQKGTVLVQCRTCETKTRLALVDLGKRLLRFAVWIPGREHSHFMYCPTCKKHSWCAIIWNE